MSLTLKEFRDQRRESLAKSVVAADEAEHRATGTPRRLSTDDRRLLVKSDSILLMNERVGNRDDVAVQVSMKKSDFEERGEEVPKYQKRLCALYDHAILGAPILQKGGVKDVRDSKWFRQESREIAEMMKREGDDDLAKIMVTGTTGSGADWVPTGFSADLWGYIDSQGKVYQQFRQTPMPWPIYQPPYIGGRITVYLGAQASENFPQTATSAIPQTKPTTGKFTLTAKKLCAMIPLTDEFNEDSVVPVLPAIREDSGKAVALARDQAILDGDTSADHMDADVDNATGTDVRLAFSGLRFYAKARGTAVDLSTFSIGNLRKIVKNMGRYGENLGDLFWVSGVKTRASILGLVVNVFNAPQYVQVTQQAGGEPQITLDFMPTLVTSRQREDLNSSGVKDLTNTGYGTILAVNKTCFTVGVRKEVETELWRDPRTQTWYLIIWERKAFGTPYTDTTNDLACMWGGNFQP